MSDALIAAAINVMPLAYAPYSQFQVGAAIEDENGHIHTGVNVENAAYPVGSCAEAGAIAAMIGAGGRKITRIAVAGRGDLLCTPCGGCRQRIREFAAADMDIFICDEQGLRQRFTLAELLPHSFGPDNLG
ncbi:MAG: cytidine deaminase [Candidatus Puniceispirillaceae bacterium]|jgi:cytidine deaminase|nr:cytidine deaminase [Pseudomonadota bacterium]MEC7245608.1 cytidine deaminase [Pseudomonadota bacterium]